MTPSFTLPPVLDLNAATLLRAEISARAGAALDLDASGVERVGGLCVQILIAAAQSWRAVGLTLQLVNPSAVFCDDLRLLGASSLIPLASGSTPPC